MNMDNLPTTRAEWEAAYPVTQTRYLAWCNNIRQYAEILLQDYGEFQSWINRKSLEYRELHHIKRDFVPHDHSEAFSAFLWGSLL
jgi:hypothetical protein